MMLTIQKLAAIISLLACWANAERGYIVTAPNQFIDGRPATVCVELFDFNTDTFMVIELLRLTEKEGPVEERPGEIYKNIYFKKNVTVDSSVLRFEPGSMSKCMELTYNHNMDDAPSRTRNTAVKLYLTIQAMTSDGWSFGDSKRISAGGVNSLVNYNANLPQKITFIQTDKPLYKPGQMVKFRSITVDHSLKPVRDLIDSIYIETPSSVRVEQWNNITTDTGMAQVEFQLSDEPEEGTWKITIQQGNRKESQKFEVKEYVLPKYSVKFTPPKQLNVDSDNATAKICAKYTFGQPVKGQATGSVCMVSGFYAWRLLGDGGNLTQNLPCKKFNQTLVDGCADIIVNDGDFGWTLYTVESSPSLLYKAAVEEYGTGKVYNVSDSKVPFVAKRMTLTMEAAGKYKPGLPFEGKAMLKTRDGSPAVGEHIEIAVGNHKQVEITDEQGTMSIKVQPNALFNSSITLKATHLEKSGRYWTYSRDIGSRYATASAWYSPSGSYLRIKPLTAKLLCGSTGNEITVDYTTNSTQSVQILTKIMGPGDMVDQFTEIMTLNTSIPTEVTYKVDGRADFPVTAFRGSFKLTLPEIRTEMSPQIHLLVYYVKQDGEIVADNEDLDIEHCLSHKVNASFNKIEVLPGEAVDLNLVAEPNALCGYGVVDQSVILAGGNNQFTVTKAIDRLRKYILPTRNMFDSSDSSFCQQQDRLRTGDTFYWNSNFCYSWRPTLSHAYTGFTHSGLTVITNFDIRNPGCSKKINFPSYRRGSCSSYFGDPEDRLDSSSSRGGENGNNNGRTSTSGNGNGRSRGTFGGTRHHSATSASGPPGALSDDHIRPTVRDGGDGRYGRDGRDGTDSERNAPTQTTDRRDQGTSPVIDVRTYFPETWLFDMIATNGKGQATVETDAPHTVTKWTGSAVCLSDDQGLGVSTPVSLIAFQPFFVSMDLPYSVIRGEKIPIAVTVSNYLTECLNVQLTMHTSDEYELITGLSKQRFCVCGDDTNVRQFTVLFNTIGQVNVSVEITSQSDNNLCPVGSEMSSEIGLSDAVIRSLFVEPEGAPREYTNSHFICFPSNETETSEEAEEDHVEVHSGLRQARSINFATIKKTILLPLPDDEMLVRGSERAFIRVVGDVMGPALTNLDQLLRIPSGCGEQNMVKFAPNIFTLDYLTAINKDDERTRQLAIRNMKSGYQRQLRYAHPDGSYSAFGPHGGEAGSTWLTAFVVKCLGLAIPYISIDSSQLRNSLEHFERNQWREYDGCFKRDGMVHNKAMQGGISNSRFKKGRESLEDTTLLTAYVLIAMLELNTTMALNSRKVSVMVEARNCLLTSEYSESDGNYRNALNAYAYALYDPMDENAIASVDQLLNSSIQVDGMTHWEGEQHSESRGSGWWYRPKSLDVETTAYVLMALLEVGQAGRPDLLTHTLPVAKWLSNQRNAFGGFGSTQDTVIGLQALTKFAKLTYSEAITANIQVTDQSQQILTTFSLSDDIRLVQQSTKIAQVQTLSVQAEGVGCFLFQANVRYNILTPDTENQAFETSLNISKTKVCYKQELNVCTRYASSDDEDESNMAIVEIKMQTGWIVDKEEMNNLLKTHSNIKRVEVSPNGAAQIYFNKLTSEQTCFILHVDQQKKVEDSKPGIVTTYDYYEQDLRQETNYLIEDCEEA